MSAMAGSVEDTKYFRTRNFLVAVGIALLVCFAIANHQISTSYTSAGQPEVTSTAELCDDDDTSTVYINTSNVIVDGNERISLRDYLDFGTDGDNISRDDSWFDVESQSDIDKPYVAIYEETLAPNETEMGVLGKLANSLFHYEDDVSQTAVLYLPDGMTVDYSGRLLVIR